MPNQSEITLLLDQIKQGNRDSQSKFVGAVYGELKKIAAAQMRKENAGHSLQASALVNEAYLRLFGSHEDGPSWENRAHFFAVAASTMRRILIDHARKRRAKKRYGGLERVDLDRVPVLGDRHDADRLLALDTALTELAGFDPRQAKVVEMHFFAGLTYDAIAKTTGLSSRTVKRDWEMARAWLISRTQAGGEPLTGKAASAGS